jgi:redox-sensitive bicupin YhaK (pirin superfamily)
MRNLAGWLGLTTLAVGLPAMAQTPIIDNERVTVWEVTLNRAQSTPPTLKDRDTVIMYLEGGRIRTASPGAKPVTTTRQFGDAVFVAKGVGAIDTLLSDGPAREIVIALKDHPVPLTPNTAHLPPAFPRPGSVQVLSNGKVAVWNYSWKPGQQTPMHFHDKDVVVAYRYDGSLKSVTPDGKATVNTFKAGEVRFNKADRSHYELLTSPRQSAVMMELK